MPQQTGPLGRGIRVAGIPPRAHSLTDHPLPALIEAGVACSVNADDPLPFGRGLLDEYRGCREDVGLDDDTPAQVARASFARSGAPHDVVQRGLRGIEAWLAA